MSSNIGGIKPRTIIEYIAILGVIYLLVSGKLNDFFSGEDHGEDDGSLPLSQEKIESLVYPDPKLECGAPGFDVHIFSRSPLIIYIPSFLSFEESQHMIDIRYASVL